MFAPCPGIRAVLAFGCSSAKKEIAVASASKLPRRTKDCLCCAASRRPMTHPASPPQPLISPLLHRVAAGDSAAVRECIAQYGGLVWSLSRRLSRSEADAEDAAQEIFLDLWKSAARFDPTVA